MLIVVWGRCIVRASLNSTELGSHCYARLLDRLTLLALAVLSLATAAYSIHPVIPSAFATRITTPKAVAVISLIS